MTHRVQGPLRRSLRAPQGARRGLGLGGPAIFLLGIAWALLGPGCASREPAPVGGWDWKGPVPQGYYLIQSGDTLGEIADRRRLSRRDLIRWNRLEPPYVIYAGRLLRIGPPDGDAGSRPPAPEAPSQGPRLATAPPTTVPQAGLRATDPGLTWAWPLEGALRQRYRAGDRTHQGLRIACRPGEPVRAAAAGEVVYAGSGLKGYGNLIIVKHDEKYLSAYGFNRRLLIAEGNEVKRGQALAECGQGPGGASLLHFEIRRDGLAVDPLSYLPPRA